MGERLKRERRKGKLHGLVTLRDALISTADLHTIRWRSRLLNENSHDENIGDFEEEKDMDRLCR